MIERKMRDRMAIIPGLLILILGVVILFTPEQFAVWVELLPLSLAGLIIFRVGTLVLVIGVASVLAERLTKD